MVTRICTGNFQKTRMYGIDRNGQVSKPLTADQYIRQIKSVAIWGFFRLHVHICRLFSNGDLPIKLPRVLYIELSIANSPKLNFSILL